MNCRANGEKLRDLRGSINREKKAKKGWRIFIRSMPSIWFLYIIIIFSLKCIFTVTTLIFPFWESYLTTSVKKNCSVCETVSIGFFWKYAGFACNQGSWTEASSRALHFCHPVFLYWSRICKEGVPLISREWNILINLCLAQDT